MNIILSHFLQKENRSCNGYIVDVWLIECWNCWSFSYDLMKMQIVHEFCNPMLN